MFENFGASIVHVLGGRSAAERHASKGHEPGMRGTQLPGVFVYSTVGRGLYFHGVPARLVPAF